MIKEIDDRDRERAEGFFTALVYLCEQSKLDPTLMNAVLAKVLVIMSLEECDKDQFMRRMNYVYDFESHMKPDQMEIH